MFRERGLMAFNLEKKYNPKNFEDKIYGMWERNGDFVAKVDESKKPFTIVMPPPNITGQLHMGHALDQTLQDVLIRWKRMQGFSALYLPGSDHASIATEVKVANQIMEDEGKTKEDLGRDEFLKRAWQWKETYGDKITRQCRKLGDSCDWSRERFTMDEGCNKAVRTFFVQLYKKGMIYRGKRLINWCPDCKTSLSDAEVEHEDKNGKYWYFRYPAYEKGGKDIVVATSRPETMFGDVAIAVNPKDERYTDMVGTHVILPIVGRKIPIIADPYPDPEKGTGAVKITPAHDPNDFEVGQRASLEVIECLNEDGTMSEAAGKYSGMDRYECRDAWVSDLERAGYLVKTEEMTIPVGLCYRCHTPVEPMISEQWFVEMKKLAEPAIEAAKSGRLKHVPDRFEKIYLHWLEGIKDWCISRQLWWGHRIPAWYCEDCGAITVSEKYCQCCEKCGSTNIKQDEDVLDTWFSSALWPFSTLGWPENTEDLKYFYPTNVLVTGYDIIFFWVVRMVFSALETMKKEPFEYVYVHGLVRDEQGRKMSKSLGNGIDPLAVIDEFGADALRFTLISGVTPGNDMRFRRDKLESSRNFANKLWNAARFTIMNIKTEDGRELPIATVTAKTNEGDSDFSELAMKAEDKWILSEINNASKEITRNLDNFDLGLAAQKVYDLIWNEYCDWYIEFVKGRLWGDDEDDKKIVRFVLLTALKELLRLLHPFMPFITEEIWGFLPQGKGNSCLINESWPEYCKDREFDREKRVIQVSMEAIKEIRNIRAEADNSKKKPLKAFVRITDSEIDTFKIAEKYIKGIANISEITYLKEAEEPPKDAMSFVMDCAEFFIPLHELMDIDAEISRLTKEKSRLEGELKRAEGKLSNAGFVNKAPKALIEKEKEKKKKYEGMLKTVIERLNELETQGQ